ncbi:hypothetical protein [Psychroflexus aestuariivivens]|uniref:hypothetical protein n=1 Tax=Psychroflexus aestuariivivens TaxID=1795040 RepID=UPI000FD9C3DD|nr:hypothetical protein [Psychroflexus aestuariivivens]
MKILFCDSVNDKKEVEPFYQTECDSAKNNGFETEVFSFEELSDENIDVSLLLSKFSVSIPL